MGIIWRPTRRSTSVNPEGETGSSPTHPAATRRSGQSRGALAGSGARTAMLSWRNRGPSPELSSVDLDPVGGVAGRPAPFGRLRTCFDCAQDRPARLSAQARRRFTSASLGLGGLRPWLSSVSPRRLRWRGAPPVSPPRPGPLRQAQDVLAGFLRLRRFASAAAASLRSASTCSIAFAFRAS